MNRKVLIALFLLWWLPVSMFTSQRDKEFNVKAVLLTKFPRFVKWPKESGMADTSKPFLLTVIGETPFGSLLQKAFTTEKRKINKKKVKLLLITSPEEINECHVLFIAASEQKNLQKILAITKDKPILTVGDTEGFAQNGVHINFYKSGERIAFDINLFAVREASLRISSSLLSLANNIITPGEKKK